MRLLIRCDGGPALGVGHVVRCLALAEEAVRRGHEVEVLGTLEGDLLRSLAADVGDVGDVGDGLTLLGPSGSDAPEDLVERARTADVLHLDHYGLPGGILEALRSASPAGRRAVLSVSADGDWGAQDADVLVDATVGAEHGTPPAAARWHLRGGRFVALRRGVLDAAEGSREMGAPSRAPRPRRVLVVMGGTDPSACAPKIVDALARVGVPLDVTVVTTSATAGPVAERARDWPGGRLRSTPPVPDLPRLMEAADLVVTAAGTTVWELCALGTAMAAVAVADNQRPGYDVLVSSGAAVGLGGPKDLADLDEVASRLRPALRHDAVRDRLAQEGHALVDGRGAWRVIRMLEEAVVAPAPRAPSATVVVRPAELDDAQTLLAWRNDPTTRAASRQHAPVRLEDHRAWLRTTLERPDRRLLVGTCAGVPVGTVRWDDTGRSEWEVSITVAPQARGRGLAGSLLCAAEDWLDGAVTPPPTGHLAVVNEDNAASRRLFVGAGYAPDLPPDAEGFERFVRFVR